MAQTTGSSVGPNGPEPSNASEAPTPAVPAVEPLASPGPTRGRRILVDALIALSTLLLIIGIFAVWANRLLFSPDNWSKTSTQLLQNEDIRASTANYLVDQLYANVDVADQIKAALPARLQPLAAPAAGALRNAAVQGVDLALTRPRVQDLWAQAHRAADKTFIAVVEGRKGTVAVNNGAVTLDLGAILDNVASRLGLPAGLSAKLPPNVATLTVLKSDQLRYVQNGGNAVKSLALWLTIIPGVLYALAVFLARGNRRRTLMAVGLSGILAGAVVLLARHILVNQIGGALTNDASLQPTIRAVVSIASAILADTAGACIFAGALFVLAGWFAGPARPAHGARRWLAPFLREYHVAAFGIALAALALLFVWDPIPATGKPAGIIVFTGLALLGTELLIRQTAREFPAAALANGAGPLESPDAPLPPAQPEKSIRS